MRAPELWVISNQHLGEKFDEQAALHRDAFYGLGHTVEIVDSLKLSVELDGNAGLWVRGGGALPRVAFMATKDLPLGIALQRLGVVVVNDPRAIELCDYKSRTHLVLETHGVRSLHSIIAPRTYPRQQHLSELVTRVIESLSLPVVVKASRGSFGAQVYRATTESELTALLVSFGDAEVVFQRYYDPKYTRDLRIQVVGTQCVAAILREPAPGEFRANLTIGAYGTPYLPTPAEQDTAIAACQAVGLEIGGVDLFGFNDEDPKVIEINSNAHISRISRLTGVNCAEAAARYIEETYLSA